LNCDSRLLAKDRKQTLQGVRRQRHAARRGRSVGPRHMHEHGAASACHPRAGVVVDLNDEIVEVVGSPEAVAAVAGRASKRAVIPPVGGILAPGEVGGNAAGGQQGARVPVAIRPPPQADRPKSPARGGAVALEFVRPDAPSAEHHRQRQRAREQDALGRAARSGPHADQRKSASAHGTSPRIRAHEPIVEVPTGLLFYPRMLYFARVPFRGDADPGAEE